MLPGEITSEADWYILDLKQRVELYDCAVISWDSACLFYETFEELEKQLRRFLLSYVQDVESKAYAVWHWAQDPPEGWPRARKDKLAPAPRNIG